MKALIILGISIIILLSGIVGLVMTGVYAIYSAEKYMKSYIGW